MVKANWLYIVLVFLFCHTGLSQNVGNEALQRQMHLGRFYMLQNRVFEAASAYRKVISFDATLTEPYLKLAKIYEILDEPDSIVHFYSLAFQSDIRVFESGFERLGDIYCQYGFHAPAAIAYSKQIDLLKFRRLPYTELKERRDSVLLLPDEKIRRGDYAFDLVFLDTTSGLTEEHKNLIFEAVGRCQCDNIILKSYHSKDLSAFEALRLTKGRAKTIKAYINTIKPDIQVLMFNYGRGKELIPNTCDRSRAFNRRVKIECK